MNSFTTSFKVDRSPSEVFDAINNVRGWWAGKITGDSRAVGSEFTYRYEDIHLSKQKVTELVPGKKVVWQVTDANLSSFENKAEWNGTEIRFELVKDGKQTEVRFTHQGLLPSCQCYGDCSNAWTFLITDSLQKLITTGKGSKFA
jgi:hypothetical protein